jgi:hypothetical protein
LKWNLRWKEMPNQQLNNPHNHSQPDKLGGVMSGHFSHEPVAVVFDGPFAA